MCKHYIHTQGLHSTQYINTYTHRDYTVHQHILYTHRDYTVHITHTHRDYTVHITHTHTGTTQYTIHQQMEN